MSSLVERLVTVRPLPPNTGWLAVRVGVSVMVPLLFLVSIDHVDWTLYATFGAFTSLYGRKRVDFPRVVRQGLAGLGLVMCVALGSLVAISDAREWLAIPIAAVIAAVASYVSAHRDLIPSGSLFQVFGFAAVASVPAHASDLVPAVLVASASALFAVLVGSLGAVVRRARHVTAEHLPEHPIGGPHTGVRLYAIQSAIGVAAAGTIATASGVGRPYWAMISAVVPLMAFDFNSQVVRGLHRVIGTFIGLGLAWLLLELDLPDALTVIFVAGLQLITELLVGRNYALALVSITPLALLIVHLAAPVIPIHDLLADRGLETVIGVAIGLLVGYATKPRATA
ncbi:MAG TPA: FUSC family protein [Nocardioidaceae bacterium]|nr:FUSC family protein [Nocardioidaceae bacterium]